MQMRFKMKRKVRWDGEEEGEETQNQAMKKQKSSDRQEIYQLNERRYRLKGDRTS